MTLRANGSASNARNLTTRANPRTTGLGPRTGSGVADVGRSAYNVGAVASRCPEKDWKVWAAFEPKVPGSSVEVMRALFERFCEEIQARGLPWGAAVHGQTIGFKARPGGEAFKVAVHSATRERGEFKPPSF